MSSQQHFINECVKRMESHHTINLGRALELHSGDDEPAWRAERHFIRCPTLQRLTLIYKNVILEFTRDQFDPRPRSASCQS